MKTSQAIDSYVERKRLRGLLFEYGELILRSFCRATGDSPLEDVTADQIQKFLDRSHGCAATYRNRHGRLREFFEHWSRRGEIPPLIFPPNRPAEPETFVPHIYTKSQIRSLLACAKLSQKHPVCVIEAATLRMFILTLYATGSKYSEVRNIRRKDVELKRCRITLRGTSHKSPRCIPIGVDLKRELQAYLKARNNSSSGQSPIFLTRFGQPIAKATLKWAFRRLLEVANIAPAGNATRAPRIKDLRPTFAVHRINGWIKSGADLNRLLPALATYMGNVRLESTDQYLSLASERFRKELHKLSPTRGRKRWRDDAELMQFLGSL